MELVPTIAVLWAVSAAIAWEVQADILADRKPRWVLIAITSLIPVYNTILALLFWRDQFSRRK
jgi:hypothetical protein